jgi:uncharacterized membrane protein YeiB
MASTLTESTTATVAPDTPVKPKAANRRVLGLDLARALALLGMFFAHFGSAAVGGQGGWQSDVTRFTDGRAMPLFVVLSGCGLTFLLARSKRPWREVASRALVLLLIGLAFEVTQPVAVILQSYAAYFLLAVLVRKMSTRWLLPAAAAVAAVGALTDMYLVEHLPSATEHVASNADTIGALNLLGKPLVLLSDLFFTGVYPVFPSFAFVLVGMWIARQDLSSRRLRAGLVGAGAALAVIGYGSGWATQDERKLEGLGPVEQLVVTADGAGVDIDDFIDAQAAGTGTTREQVIEVAAAEFGLTGDELMAQLDAAERAPEVRAATEPDGWDLLNQSGHSNMPAWMIGASGLSCFVIGLCLVLADLARRLIWPLAALGQLSLTAYVTHLALFRWPMKNWPWGFTPTEGLVLTTAGWLAAAVVAAIWRMKFRQGPLEHGLRAAGRLGAGMWSTKPTQPAAAG